ncbi:MAG: hypothetical protein IPP69_03225 [Flavobacteriales bacterium]|nr:hypothetical protein [Flavobacteriales bacterium]
MSIITQAPVWLIVICIIAGAAYAGALYFKDRFNRTYGTTLATVLGLFRFACVTILAIFLLKPLIRLISYDVEKPVIVIAQDDSESIVVGKDSSYYRNEYANKLRELVTQFGDDYEIKTLHFGDQVSEGLDSLSFTDQLTDFSGLLDEIYTRYSGRNLGAIIIASDGLYNKGSNPVFAYKKLNVPVYTVALGDTTVYKDILISEVATNRLAYLGNKFPMEITVEGRKAAGANAVLTVSKKGNVLHSSNIAFSGDRYTTTIPLTFDATETGLQKYSVHLSGIDGEMTLANNHKDVFIDVLDSRQKVLILAYAPHPDINAMRDAIASNESYKVDVKLAKDFNGNINEYSLVIFHQLPAAGSMGQSIITNALEQKIPSLFVWGNATDYNAFNKMNLGYSLNGYMNNATDIGGYFAEEFTLFTLDEQVRNMFRNMPPLTVPFGDYTFSPGVSPLIYQQVGQIKTRKPLISFNKVNDTKVGLIAGEGIWRWKLTAFQQFESHDAFHQLITKLVQYSSAKEDKSLLRVNGKNDFYENEQIIFDAELYNQSYEAITNKEIGMRIISEDGKEYNYLFSVTGNRYRLNAGQLPVGNYNYEASVNGESTIPKERGEFSISPLQLEVVHTIADHRLMYQLAADNNGEMIYPSALSSLTELIKNKKDIVSVSYENKQLNELINYRWILALILLLLSAEWLLRKRAGTY